MSSQTPNLNLVLPVGTEHVSRQIINDNNTKIDTAVGANSTAISKLDSNANSTTDILATALTCTKTAMFKGAGSSYTGSVPKQAMRYGTFFVNVIANDKFVLCQSTAGVHYNSYSGNSWAGWKELATDENIKYQEITITLTSSTGRTISQNAGLSGYKLISATFVQNDDLYYTCVTDGIYPVISITSNEHIQLLGMNKNMQTSANRNLKILCVYKAV